MSDFLKMHYAVPPCAEEAYKKDAKRDTMQT